jgi:NADPH2:quinone reductase
MKALRLVDVKRLEIADLPAPSLPEGHALIEVKACGICMSDVHMFLGHFPVNMPVTVGHEFGGIVKEIRCEGKAAYRGSSETTRIREGDRVVVNPLLHCGSCSSCLTGRYNLCLSPKALGGAGDVVIDGAFAEYVAVPLSALGPLPAQVGWDEATMVEPVGCCLHGIDRSRIRQGHSVAVIGAGVIGLLLIQLVLLQGADRVIAVEKNDQRRLDAEKAGAYASLDPSAPHFMESFFDKAEAKGVDVVIEAVGSAEACRLAMDLVKKGGVVNIFGVPPKDAAFPCRPFTIFYDEIDLVGSYSLTPDNFKRSLALLKSGRVDVKRMITHRYPLERGPEGFEMAIKGVGLKKVIFPS